MVKPIAKPIKQTQAKEGEEEPIEEKKTPKPKPKRDSHTSGYRKGISGRK